MTELATLLQDARAVKLRYSEVLGKSIEVPVSSLAWQLADCIEKQIVCEAELKAEIARMNRELVEARISSYRKCC